MAVFSIPTSVTEQFYAIEIELDGVIFKLQFKFNNRDSAWYLDILDIDENHLRSGIRVVNDWALLRLWKQVSRPAGEIIPVADEQQSGPAGVDELGASVILTYVGEA